VAVTNAIELLLYPYPESPPDRGGPDGIGAQVQSHHEEDRHPTAEHHSPVPAPDDCSRRPLGE
jgi:hypothetical protein